MFDVNDYGYGKLYAYYADSEDVKKVIKTELNKMSKEELIDFIFDTADPTDLEEIFEEELQDEFAQDAEDEFYGRK